MNGKTIHVVQRSPPSAHAASASGGASGSTAEPGPARDQRPRIISHNMEPNSFMVGSFSLPQDATDVNQVHVSILAVNSVSVSSPLLSSCDIIGLMLKFKNDFMLGF